MWVNCRERRIFAPPRFAASAAFTQTKTPSHAAVALDCCLTTIGNPALKHHAAAGVSVAAARPFRQTQADRRVLGRASDGLAMQNNWRKSP